MISVPNPFCFGCFRSATPCSRQTNRRCVSLSRRSLRHLIAMWPFSTESAPYLAAFVVKIGRAHVCTPVTNAHLVCRLLLEKKKKTADVLTTINNTHTATYNHTSINVQN